MPDSSGLPSPATPSALTALGYTDRWAAVLATTAPGAAPARVVRDDRGAVVAVGVTHGLDRPLNRRRLERGLVLAWEGGRLRSSCSPRRI